MLYKRGIEVLLTGVKYEKNETAKQMILKRVEGYMKRAEDLKDVVNQQRQGPTKGGTGTLDKGKASLTMNSRSSRSNCLRPSSRTSPTSSGTTSPGSKVRRRRSRKR